MMDILVMCPANVATGGPETLHKLVSDLNRFTDIDAKILYRGMGSGDPQPESYKIYDAPYITEFPMGYRGAVIVPEIWAHDLLDQKYTSCTKAIFWLSVDNYRNRLRNKTEEGLFLRDPNILHIAQSFYTEEYLGGLGAKHIIPLQEPVNDIFFEDYEEDARKDTILYNPAKMTAFEEELIDYAEIRYKFQFEPLSGCTVRQVADKLRHHKLYIDFGPFPGRERIPREAVLSGCCLITGKNGASQYFKDIPILNKYKFDTKSTAAIDVIQRMNDILTNYSTCKQDFDYFRQVLREEKRELYNRIRNLKGELDAIQHNHTSI